MEGSSDFVSPATLSISQCVTLKLNEKKYFSWKLQFEQFLNSQMLLGFVTGATPRPQPLVQVRNGDIVTESSNPEFMKWVQTDQLIMAWLFGSLSEEALKSIYGLRSSQEVWLYLAKKYNRVSSSRKLDLQRKIQTTVKGSNTLAKYLAEIKTLCDQLDSIGSPISEQEKIFGVLRGLGREYESITTVIEDSMDKSYPGLTLDDVVYKLTCFDDKLQGYEVSTEVTPHQAFYTDRGGYNGRGRGQNRGGNSNKGRGSRSYSTQGRSFPQQFGQGSGGRQPFSDNGQKPTCQICGKYGHPAYRCYKRFDHSYQVDETTQALAVMRMSDNNEYSGREWHPWHPDTAATHHVTNSVQNLQSSHSYDGSDAVMVGNGEFLPITHIGSANIPTVTGNLHLKDVLICPEIAKCLLSVSKLTDDYPCAFIFDSRAVSVIDKQTNQLLTQGTKSNGLYQLDNPNFQAFYSSRQQSTSGDIWHRRLGHPNNQVLQHLSSVQAISFNKNTLSMCEPCQLGKSCKLPFSSSDFQSSRPLERIHCDVWGPAPVMSVQGFRFYVIFIDNFSRFCWFYPLKQKSEVFTIFKSFQLLAENQLNQKIKIFQSDGGVNL